MQLQMQSFGPYIIIVDGILNHFAILEASESIGSLEIQN